MDILPFRSNDRAPASASPIFVGFDTVRALAALGVIALHSCVPYLRHPMPGLAWPVKDAQSDLIDCLFWSIEVFIMPVFLVLAGFLALQTLQRRGPTTLVRNRASRLLKPLLFGMIVILPMDLYAWILGWVAEGLLPMVKLKSLKIDGPLGENLWGLSHLWFLQYLFLYVLVLAAWIAMRMRFSKLKSLTLNSRSMVLLISVVGVLTLMARPEVVWGFQHAFEPVPSKWIYSGTFFLGGVWIGLVDPKLTWLRRHALRIAFPALLFGVAAVAMGRWHLSGGEGKTASVMLAATTVVAAWTSTLSLLGLAARSSSVSLGMKYLAAASFWIYLVHHPILGIVHLDLKWLLPGLSPILKSIMAFTITTGTCLIAYEALIRKTSLGRWLGFAWTPAEFALGPDEHRLGGDECGIPDHSIDSVAPLARRAAGRAA